MGPHQRRTSASHQRRAEFSAGAAILALCLGVGVVVLLTGMRPYIPVLAWSALLVACLVGVFFAAAPVTDRRIQLASYALAVLSSWALLLTLPGQGMLVVILVVVAAVGTYVVPMAAVVGVVALNTVVIAVHAWAHGAGVVDYVATPIFYLFIHLAAVLSTWSLQQEARMRAALEQKTVELTAASVLLEDSAKTAERLRISRDLHDLLGHQLTVLNLELEAARHRSADSAAEHVERASGLAKKLLGDVRSTVGEMRAADHGDLAEALQRVAAAVPSLDIWIRVETDVEVDEQQQDVLVRAAQEIMTNTIKHSEAWTLRLDVARQEDRIVLTGVNDGTTPSSVTPGHGLTGLRERVELLGGTLTVTPRRRFTVQVDLPAHGRRAGSTLEEADRA
ncbi:sensor histidine kinase [Nesterenkonia sp. PF2B19]|uniref:sensor histidine kinase n=1 Tax=unclassified Nesterenkonia TaxID=2629769 RepID=UPI000A19BEB0|nr:histidine kinase [Nesterenkonia sp. PF2B19]OSM44479.1 hypothetical protein BCY76_001930 [Nesterenkonia sp. PF2B19]